MQKHTQDTVTPLQKPNHWHRKSYGDLLHDPEGFAAHLYSDVCAGFDVPVVDHAVITRAKLYELVNQLMESGLTDAQKTTLDRVSDYIEDYALCSRQEGAAWGRAAERFRLFVVNSGQRVCPACDGQGHNGTVAPYDNQPAGRRTPVDCSMGHGVGFVYAVEP